jgi:hypothetical protein
MAATGPLEQVFGKTVGRHSLRFGGIYGRLRVTRENIEMPSVRYANINDFLANQPNFVQVTFGVDEFAILAANYGFFIQDDFRLSRRLMLNLGIRYDYYTVPRERDGRFFNRDAPFGAGPFRDPESIYEADRNNFSPRVGFAYTADSEGKTVIRGGFGMFHSPLPIFGSSIDNVQNAADEPFRSQFSAADVARFPTSSATRWSTARCSRSSRASPVSAAAPSWTPASATRSATSGLSASSGNWPATSCSTPPMSATAASTS